MDGGSTRPDTLAPPAVTQLRAAAMERTLSEDMREEGKELREAAEQTLNALVDLNLDGTIRWVSPSWVDVVGTQTGSIQGTAIADLVVSENKTIFTDVLENMKSDESRSQFIRCAVRLGPLSKLLRLDAPVRLDNGAAPQPAVGDFEAQGIMVYDSGFEGTSHTMWMMRPWVAPREIKIDLPDVIVDSLGSGAEVLASYLTQLAECGIDDAAHQSPLPPLLCRICERQIPPWWFEKHTDLCLQEHRAEMDVQMAQENLTEHRHAIVNVLDALETRKSRTRTGDAMMVPAAAYKGMPIGPPASTSPSPGHSAASSRDRSSGLGHARGRSFAIRRPQARIVELLLDLCDTTLEINTPAIKESSQVPGEIRALSPQSEGRMTQVLQWETPSTNTLEQEQGLALLVADTEQVAKAKVEAVVRHRKVIEYAERIRVEFALLVQECIDEAMRKAAKIAAGRLSDSTDTEGNEETSAGEEDVMPASLDARTSLALALQNVQLGDGSYKRRLSAALDPAVHSRGSNSPRDCPTPRSHCLADAGRSSRRQSLLLESDTYDSDGSMRSTSATSRAPRTGSPVPDVGGHRRRQASTCQHHRTSLGLPGAASPRRQESPSRPGQPPLSPLRTSKPRSGAEGLLSPEPSPMLASWDLTSPGFHHHGCHHRRQSSAAVSELGARPPPSPRLSAVVSAPPTRAVAPSIKDFEIIKPISKGAFGSVYLSKKKSTGAYFAIKVLKKADMVAKNQVMNVKAERAIMMWQGESDFVAKLYWTFSSKDYLYLVMEYLNGGDCASLIKVLGGLPEDWVHKYLGEVVLGVEHLHSRGIVHRDLKPDNLLIDQKGHLKLTDFGLSRMGLVGRQKRALQQGVVESAPDLLKQGPFARSASVASSRSTSLDLHTRNLSAASTPQTTPIEASSQAGQPSYFSLGPMSEPRRVSGHGSDSGASEAPAHMTSHISEPPAESEAEGMGSPDLAGPQLANASTSPDMAKSTATMAPPNWALFDPHDSSRRFVGTPDYLAPETIRGEPQDETSDWWSVGCIMFEMLFGYPPFHAGEAERVFENILARKMQWPDESGEVTSPAKDLVNKLLTADPRQRLGSNRLELFQSGGEEIRNHAWFRGMNWDTLLHDEAQFVPRTENPEDTDYFDARGATLQAFAEEMEDQASPAADLDRPHDALSRARVQSNAAKRGLMPLHIPPHVRDSKSRRLSEPMATDDFGTFSYKNLPVLDRANKDVIQKLRAEAAQNKPQSPGTPAQTSPGAVLDGSPVLAMPVQRTLSNAKAAQRPQSPSPSRVSQPSPPLLVSFVAQAGDGRRKTTSGAPSLAQPLDARVPPGLHKAATTAGAVSPAKPPRGFPPPLALSLASTPRQTCRSRSLTVGSQDGSPVALDALAAHKNRHSQVFDMSPSSSDNEADKANARLQVQRRRHGARRLSQLALDGPVFRPLDVLIAEDHPVSRMVMEKLLEKQRCRTISAHTGPEVVRYAMSDIRFDVIFMEYRLPQINGADVARMVRETHNANSRTPIVAITAYLKVLQGPHYFDSLVEKPISSSKLAEVLASLCQWKPASPSQSLLPLSPVLPHPIPSGLRQESLRLEDSPMSGSATSYAHRSSSSFREGSISSSLFGDSESVSTDEVPVLAGRKVTVDWGDDGGLGISAPVPDDHPLAPVDPVKSPPQLPPPLVHLPPSERQKRLAPRPSSDKLQAKRASMEKRRFEGSVDSADDEDEEDLGLFPTQSGSGSSSTCGSCTSQPIPAALSPRHCYRSKAVLPSSKLGIEMMRANSHDSVVEGTVRLETQGTTTHVISPDLSPLSKTPEPLTPPSVTVQADNEEGADGAEASVMITTPPGQQRLSAKGDGTADASGAVDETPRPTLGARTLAEDDEPTPRAARA